MFGSSGGRSGTTVGFAVMVLMGAGFAILAAGGGAGATVAHAKTCNLTVNTENLAGNAVQTAINSANPGWTVCLGAGTFPEQIDISKKLTLSGAGQGVTFLAPTTVVANTVDWDSAPSLLPVAAIVLIDNATSVTITGVDVNGTAAAASSFSGCGTTFVGIDYQNSTGTISSDKVNGIEFSASLLGCQGQLAIYAYTGFFATGFTPSPANVVTISKVTVNTYGKNGITCDDPGLTCSVSSSTVAGIGGTSAIAQNGIQVAYGALGHLTSNKVSADNYTGSGSTLDWYGTGTQGAGILLYNAGSGTTVNKNTLSTSPFAIADVATTAASVFITGNSVTSFTGYAIVVNGAPGSTALITNNTVNALGTGAAGILVDNGTFNVSENKISHVSTSGTQGSSQVVCGTGSYLSCGTTLSIRTAGIQAVSEGAGGLTDVTLFANTFTSDSLSIATLAMPTGAVTLQFT